MYMNENKNNVYKELAKIKMLDADSYSRLLSIYGEELVNKTIEQMIDDNSRNLIKFDYYVSKIIAYDDMVSKNSFELYGMDLACIPRLSKDESMLLMKEIFEIINKINTLLNEIACENEIYDFLDKTWLCDRIELCLDKCSDVYDDKLLELRKLYKKFINKRNYIAECNLRLVITVAKRNYINGNVFNDAIQYGNMGLLRAIEKFDPSFNVTFATYAYYWIRQLMMRNIYNVIYSVSIPAGKVRFYNQMKKVIREFEHEYGRTPSDIEISNIMDKDVETISTVRRAFNEGVSLYDSVAGKDNDDSMIIDFVVDENASATNEVMERVIQEEISKIMDTCLNEKEKRVIEERFGFIDGSCPTLDKVGEKMGVTRERIRQIESKSLRKLKYKFRDFEGYLD